MGISQAEYLNVVARLHKQNPQPVSQAVEREADLHQEIIDYCKGKMWPYVHNRMDKISTSTPGTPDFEIYASFGITLHIEAKTVKGKLSREQLGFHMMAQRNGHQVYTVRSMDEFLQVVDCLVWKK
jgi:hypothetical protein